RTMLMDLLPQTSHAYTGQTVQLGAALAMMCAQEFDRAAARLAEENAVLTAVFADAGAVVAADTLRTDLQSAIAEGPCSLLVTALQERNRSLRALLIRLHAHIETLDGEAARALDARIWSELVESTRRRHLDLAQA